MKYISIIHITTRNEEVFFKYLDKTLHKYNSEVFNITIIHEDNEFKPIMDKVKDELGVTMNCANPVEHFPEVD